MMAAVMDAIEVIRLSETHLPLDVIDTSPRWWRIDVPPTKREVATEMAVISAHPTGEIGPVVVRRSAQEANGYELVEGSIRLEACRRLGWTEVPVRILSGTETDAGIFLLGQDLRAPKPKKTLSRSWAALRLFEQGGVIQRELAVRVGVTEQTMSEFLRIARAVPEAWAGAVASEMGIPMSRVEVLPRSKLRTIVDAEEDARDALLREALTPRPKRQATSPGEVGEVLGRVATLGTTVPWFVRVRGWLAKLGAFMANAVRGGRETSTYSTMLKRLFRPSSWRR